MPQQKAHPIFKLQLTNLLLHDMTNHLIILSRKNKQKTVIRSHQSSSSPIVWNGNFPPKMLMKIFWVFFSGRSLDPTQNFGFTGERSCGCREAQAPKVSPMALGGGLQKHRRSRRRKGDQICPRDLKDIGWASGFFYLFCWYIEMGRFYTKSISW